MVPCVQNGHSAGDVARRLRRVVVEVVQRDHSGAAHQLIQEAVEKLIRKDKYFNTTFPLKEFKDPFLAEHVESVRVCCEESNAAHASSLLVEDYSKEFFIYRVYKLDRQGAQVEEIFADEEGGEPTPGASHWVLPSADFEDLWENLIYDEGIKTNLLRFVETSLLMSEKKVNSHVISYNRVVLLHGPPGTGKTSLCQALAHKLAVRLTTYPHAKLIEINSHSLFSKWFSESGKLVQKMFAEIRELIAEPGSFVCVLIDEVESLIAARRNSSAEPSDAVRVVNAVLTQLDSIRHFPNVLILTTSNITGAIDLAFVDRADIKQYIGLPSQAAIYSIFYSCILELQRSTILFMKTVSLSPLASLNVWWNGQGMGDTIPAAIKTDPGEDCLDCSPRLWNIAGESVGLSGRTIKRLPFLALASVDCSGGSVDIGEYLVALQFALTKELADRKQLATSSI